MTASIGFSDILMRLLIDDSRILAKNGGNPFTAWRAWQAPADEMQLYPGQPGLT
jgi:hypothetical protein